MGRLGGIGKRTTSWRAPPVGLKSVTALVKSARPAAAQARFSEVARGVHERVRPAAAEGRVLEPVRVVGSVPGVVAEHGPAPFGALSRLSCRRGERVAAGERGEGLGHQHLALRLARGGRVSGERHGPGFPGVAEVAAQRGQGVARLRRVDRAAEAGEGRVDETRGRRLLGVPRPDRRRETLDLPRALRAEVPVGAEGEDVAERVGRAERLEAGEPLGTDALRVLEERAPLGVAVAAAGPRVEHDADAPAVGPLEDEERRHFEAAPLAVVVVEGHGQPADARPGQQGGRAPGERGQLRVVGHVDRHAPGALEAAGGIERSEEGLLALPAPEGVVQEGAEGDPALAKPPDELVPAVGVELEERQGLVRHGHRVPVAVPLRLAVRARHRVEVGAHELGHVPAGRLLVEAPRGVGAGVVDDVDGPGRPNSRGCESRLGRRGAGGARAVTEQHASPEPTTTRGVVGEPKRGNLESAEGPMGQAGRLAPTSALALTAVTVPAGPPVSGAREPDERRADVPCGGRARPDRRGRDRERRRARARPAARGLRDPGGRAPAVDLPLRGRHGLAARCRAREGRPPRPRRGPHPAHRPRRLPSAARSSWCSTTSTWGRAVCLPRNAKRPDSSRSRWGPGTRWPW